MPSDNPVASGASFMASSGPKDSTNIFNHFRYPKAVDCCVSAPEDILRDMTLNFDIYPRPPISGVGSIKVQEGKHGMVIWTRYNIVAMLSNWKLEKLKIHWKIEAKQAAVYIACYDNGLQNIRLWTQVRH